MREIHTQGRADAPPVFHDPIRSSAVDPFVTIQALLGRARRRARVLLALRGAAQGMLALCLGLAILAVVFTLGAARAQVLPWVVGAGLPAVVAAMAWPAARDWLRVGKAVVLARRFEQVQPALRGRMLTAVDRADLMSGEEEGAKPAPAGASRVLLRRAATKAATLGASVPPGRLFGAGPALAAGGAAGASFLFCVVLGLLLPVGPLDAVAILGGESAAEQRLEGAQPDLGAEPALVGDITLEYIFPEYTGLDRRVVPNSDGTIHAPPGTVVRIRARTERTFQAAALRVDERPPVDASLDGGRDLGATLTVERDGVWRFVLFEGNEAHLSPKYRIEAEADAPPVVTAESSGSDMPIDRPVSIGWQVKDDYGVERVVLEVEKDGVVREIELRRPLDPTTEMMGVVRMSPRELGLEVGDQATLRVVAYDSDRAGQAKRGVSEAVAVEVTGPRGGGQRMGRYYRELLDALLPVLADFLEEDVPPALASAGMQRWVGQARRRFEPAQAIFEAQWGDERPTSIDGQMMQELFEGSARLMRFAVTTWEPGTPRRVTSADLATFGELHEGTVVQLEKTIYVLDDILKQAATADFMELASHVAEQAQQLAALADDAEAGELLARLDQLERMLSEMAHAAEQMQDGALQEFANSRINESMNLLQEIRKAIAEGRMDDARQMLDQLAQQLEQFAQGMQDMADRQQEGENALAEMYDAVQQELDQLKTDQQTLNDELEALDQGSDGQVSEQLALWKQVREAVEAAQTAAESSVAATGDAQGWRAGSIVRLERLAQGHDRLLDAVRAHDRNASLDELDDMAQPLAMAIGAVRSEATRGRPETEPAPSGIQDAAGGLDTVIDHLRTARKLLESMPDEGESQVSEAVQQQAQQMAGQQAQLQQRAQDLGEMVEGLENAMPTGDGKATEAMEQAGQSMGRAGEELSQGQPQPGRGHGQEAVRRLDEASQRLQQQMQENQQMQQQSRGMQQRRGEQDGEGEGEEGEENGEQMSDRDRIEIPPPEEFQTPEAYRRALLEGMEGDVPEEFRALKRRYYEELVQQ